MTYNVIVPSKTEAGVEDISFQFQSMMDFGEVITGYNISISVFTGEDLIPESVLNGSPTVSSYDVVQPVHDGISGVVYAILCTVTTSASNIYSRLAYLAVID